MESVRRVVILAVRPEVDGGRYPVKRIINEPVAIEADIVVDGHDSIAAVVYDESGREAELVAAGNDVWRATLTFTTLGRHAYTVAAWVDVFASWRKGLERKLAAGVDVSVEMLEGALLVDAGYERSRDPALRDAAAVLRSKSELADRAAVALGADLSARMARSPDRSAATVSRTFEIVIERPLARATAWYELFPRSTRTDGKHGSLRDTEGRLDYIAELGFDVVYLPPIHPIGRTFRKGPDNAPTAGPDDPGSPWAIGAPEGGHTAIHPELGTLADFDRFVAAAKSRKLEVALDIAFQASADHPWVREHRSWFKARPDGTIQYAENPPKKYQDVYPFDFESKDWQALWAALRDVFVFWCERGVRVFRVDNPHTKPIPFWEWCLREVTAKYPDAIFLAEAFTRPKLMYALGKAGFSQSYTYFTWRTTKAELEEYGAEISSHLDLLRPSFWPTTPDIFPEHLVHGGRAAFILRVVLAGTMAASYGIYGPSYELLEHEPRKGVEELARNEKYQIRTWDLGQADSIRHVIARLNKIRHDHPALHDDRSLHFHETDSDLVICYSKRTGDDTVITVVNLDPHHTHRAWLTLDLEELGVDADHAFQVHELLGDAHYTWRGPRAFVELDPTRMPAHIFTIKRFVRTENQFEYFL